MPFYPGARDLLEQLREDFRIACLSNSNAAHWHTNYHVHGVQQVFNMAMSSHQLGFHKPDARIYVAAMERLKVSAESIVFFDDNLANVVAARQLGMRAFKVRGVEQLTQQLLELGLI
jgi:glucose-1-phosphatase